MILARFVGGPMQGDRIALARDVPEVRVPMMEQLHLAAAHPAAPSHNARVGIYRRTAFMFYPTRERIYKWEGEERART